MTTGDDGDAAPRQVHVSELLAAHGRTVAPSGRRRRRVDPDDAPVPVAPAPDDVVPDDVVPDDVVPDDVVPDDVVPDDVVPDDVVPDDVVPDDVVPDDVVPDDVVPDDVVPDDVVPDDVVFADEVAPAEPVLESPAPVLDLPASQPAPLADATEHPATAAVPVGTASTVDVPVDPAPVDPAPVDPGPVDLAPVDPAPVDPGPVDPAPVDPAPVDPGPTAVGAPVNPAREWAVVGVQLVGALAGGAALWFAFRWLWEWQSVVALVLSAVVIVGLVVVVRVLRRAEDLFSTVLAVLAGLIVTVSPPVLTLTGG